MTSGHWLKAFVIAAAAILVVAAIIFTARERLWALAIGPADMGPIEFATLVKPSTPNTWLVCSPEHCRNTTPDQSAPEYGMSELQLRQRLISIWQSQPRTVLAAGDAQTPGEIRFVQYSALFGFPDTISVHTFALDTNRSTLAIYSRSQIGRSDLGANRERISRWLAKL